MESNEFVFTFSYYSGFVKFRFQFTDNSHIKPPKRKETFHILMWFVIYHITAIYDKKMNCWFYFYLHKLCKWMIDIGIAMKGQSQEKY